MRLGRTWAAFASWRRIATVGVVLLALGSSSSNGIRMMADAKADAPAVSLTTMEHMPQFLQYFEDSNVVLFQDTYELTVYRSDDAGKTWKEIDAVPRGEAYEVTLHPYDHQRAYILTLENGHWMTADRGATWTRFEVPLTPTMWAKPLNFHADNPDKVIFNGGDCVGLFCTLLSYYTTDGFKTVSLLRRDTPSGCSWAKSSHLFTTGNKDLDADRILCVANGQYSTNVNDRRIVVSDSYFVEDGGYTQEFEPELDAGRTVDGIVNIAIEKKYLLAASRAPNTDEMALYVTDDTITWHRAMFPHDHRLVEDAYTVLESTNYSIQVDVMTTRLTNPMGVLLSSNSNGTYFTRNIEHTNRNFWGYVDFEKMTGIQGIIMVNVVDNWEKVEDSFLADKKVVSKISFDDGRTFQDLKTAEGKRLHLHSVTDIHNSGRIFSSPAPGLVMGVGVIGDFLTPYAEGNLYVSDDAGATWRKALDGPHKYEFGDQGSILLAAPEGATNKLSYSLNHGKAWTDLELPKKMTPIILTTVQDSTSLKFLLIGEEQGESPSYPVVTIDFADMHERECKDGDMQKWYARVDSDGNPTCIMGHKQYFKRRKPDADCFINNQNFQEALPQFEPCECTDADFECDFNFVRSADRSECIRAGNLVVPNGACEGFDDDTTFKGSSGWRLIPGNECKRKSGPQKDDLVDRKCSEAYGAPASGNLQHTQTTFNGDIFVHRIYLERTETSAGEDETILTRTDQGLVYVSNNHGKLWEQILENVRIVEIFPHPKINDVVYLLSASGDVYYTVNRFASIEKFTPPQPHRGDRFDRAMQFHPDPKHKDWIIWHGGVNCDIGSRDCHTVAYLSEDRGDSWKTLQRYVDTCQFMANEVDVSTNYRRDDKLVYCSAHQREEVVEGDNPLQLVSSADWFTDERNVYFDSIQGFATMAEFIIVAAKDTEGYLKVDASLDGATFAEAQFPPNFQVEHQQAYTVLDSSTHAVFLHVTVDGSRDSGYGAIIKSNSNGTSYVMTINGVNRDAFGYVDFEKLYGLEGVALVNTVANYDAKDKSSGKKLKTMITHNDGAEWSYLPPPEKDVDGKKWGCSGSLEKCALHLHGYTERLVKSHTYAKASAVGLAMATGNVGEFLGSSNEVSTFVTRDAGITWKEVKKGAYMWAFGDQGSYIAIVKQNTPTNVIYYTLDEGETWKEYRFSGEELHIDDITTVPSANSRNVLLWGRDDQGLVTINVDFAGLTNKQCTLREKDAESDDYYLWTPKHPKMDDDCLFGHVAQYHRKRVESNCYNGPTIKHLHNIARNCSCTRQDFECDFNYQRHSDGSCALVEGLSPQDHSQICRDDPDAVEYYDPTGYRRIPLTTCQGGRELEFTSAVHPCPGKEEEFYKRRGISGVGLFFAIVTPIAIAAAAGWWVYRNWEGKFGQIRLGEQSSMQDEPYIKYPVMAIAALVSIAQALPLLVSGIWRSASTALGVGGGTRRFTTRSSFARGRGDYAIVDEDEGELLGDESDDEV